MEERESLSNDPVRGKEMAKVKTAGDNGLSGDTAHSTAHLPLL